MKREEKMKQAKRIARKRAVYNPFGATQSLFPVN